MRERKLVGGGGKEIIRVGGWVGFGKMEGG